MGLSVLLRRVISLVCLLVPLSVQAAVVCDGTDDSIDGIALSNYITNNVSALSAWYTATTTGETATTCWQGRAILSDAGGYYGLLHNVVTTQEQYCSFNYDGVSTHRFINTTLNTLHHLMLTHTGGNLRLYYDGVASADTTSGNTQVLTNTFHACKGAGAFGAGVIEAGATFSSIPSDGEIAAIALSRTRRLWKTARTGTWDFDECNDGAACNGVTFKDRSGNGRDLTGNDGANNTGLTGKASVNLRYPGGMQ